MDNLSGKLTLVVYAEPGVPGAFKRAQARLKELLARLREPVAIPAERPATPQAAASAFGEEAFKQAVARAKHYIFDGDIMQVVLSQRMSQPFAASPLSLYRALRTLNPSPYMFYFDFGDFHVVGASPEILVRLEDDNVTVRPIAGTRPRGKTREEDEALAAELLADPKERAEHLMLIDLGRNDVGRVAQTGTCSVTEQMVIERYSHVMHIVSNVEGQAEAGARRDGRAARHLPGRHGVAARRRCARWRSSTSWSRSSAASTPAPSAISASTATWTSPSPSAPPWSRTAAPRAGRRRHRRRLRPGRRVAGDAEQGARPAARRRDGRVRPRHAVRVRSRPCC